MKSSSDRCLSLLGCTSHTCIAPHQTVGTSVQIIVPSPDDSVSINSLSLSLSLSLIQHILCTIECW